MSSEDFHSFDFQFNHKVQICNQAIPSNVNRQDVKEPWKQFPYKAIGKLLSYFYQNEKQKKEGKFIKIQGTAFYIGKNVLLTVAHNICLFNNQMAKKVYFYPAQNNEQKRIKIKAIKYRKVQGYTFSPDKLYGPNIYDLALIQLEQIKGYTNEQHLNIKWDYKANQNPKQILTLAGYPDQYNKHDQACYMYEDKNTAVSQDQFYLFYKHLTSQGQSGMPIIQKDAQNKFWVIGVHKANIKSQNKRISNTNFGLNLHVLKNTRQMISELAEQMQVERLLGLNYKPSYKKLLSENNMLRQDNKLLKYNGQQLEKKVQQLEYQVQQLKSKVQQLEQENNILKNNTSFYLNNQSQKYILSQQQKQNKSYIFIQNEQAKQKGVIISNEYKTIEHNNNDYGIDYFNLIDGKIYKNGSKIKIKIQSFQDGFIQLDSQINHGAYLIHSNTDYNQTYTLSHSQPEYNNKSNKIKSVFKWNDIISVEVNENQIKFIKQTQNNQTFSMPIKLTSQQFNDIAFCINVRGQNNSTTIVSIIQ